MIQTSRTLRLQNEDGKETVPDRGPEDLAQAHAGRMSERVGVKRKKAGRRWLEGERRALRECRGCCAGGNRWTVLDRFFGILVRAGEVEDRKKGTKQNDDPEQRR